MFPSSCSCVLTLICYCWTISINSPMLAKSLLLCSQLTFTNGVPIRAGNSCSCTVRPAPPHHQLAAVTSFLSSLFTLSTCARKHLLSRAAFGETWGVVLSFFSFFLLWFKYSAPGRNTSLTVAIFLFYSWSVSVQFDIQQLWDSDDFRWPPYSPNFQESPLTGFHLMRV